MGFVNYYCRTDGGWYSMAFHGFIPDDSVGVKDEDYEALRAGQLLGKWLVADEKGYPVLIDPPPLSDELLSANERAWRSLQLVLTDGVVTRHRDEIEEGSTTTLTLQQYAELQSYRRLLRNWPEAGEFPLSEHRPPAPTWLPESTQ